MEAFLPSSGAAALTASWLLVGLAVGHAAARRAARGPDLARALAWGLTVGGALAVDAAALDDAPGFRMVAIILALLVGMKTVVAVEHAAQGGHPLTFARWNGFVLLWLGMDPRPFEPRAEGPASGGRALLLGGTAAAILGLAGIALARALAASGAPRLVVSILLLVSLSSALHFGLLRLLAGFWRLRGVHARDLFRAPILSTNLREFWGIRWNLGFHEMTRTAVYRPLAPHVGRANAILACFVFSGLLHEAAISRPVKAGYGGPLAYFALQGTFLLAESALAARGLGPRGVAGRLWTLVCLVVPLPLLFHRPFLDGVVLPLAR